jgi:hypothetical protein
MDKIQKSNEFIPKNNMLWRVEPLLCNDREMGGYTRTFSGQRFRKHVSAATDMNVTTEEMCFLYCLCRDVIRKGQVDVITASRQPFNSH